MKFRNHFINIILLAALAGLTGCQTTDDKDKEVTALRLHSESTPDGTTFTRAVPIYRANPTYVTVESSPFADERDVEHAEVVDLTDGFAIQLQFGRHGQWMLENITRSNPNRHIALQCQFDAETRWLAAPLIKRPISNGTLTFTPDATREESDRIVRGLNNVAAKLKKDSTSNF